MEKQYTNKIWVNVSAAVIVVTALLLVPAPLLPPHFLAEKVQFYTGVKWKVAYLVAAIGLQAAFFFSIGVLSAFVVKRSPGWQKRLVQIVTVPIVIVLITLIVRSMKMGHFPVWVNAVIPLGACVAGVWLGLGLRYQRSLFMLFILAAAIGVTFWGLSGTMTPELSRATENQLEQLTLVKKIPAGDARFGSLLQTAFITGSSSQVSAVQHNRAAILALGIALGHERLAKFVDLDHKKDLVKKGAQLRQGTTLRGRNDWIQHFCLSAALAVLEDPLVSDAGGLLKEQLDALSGGSGFSFGDYAADRAGVRFARAATNSEEDAKAMQDLLTREFDIDNFFPQASDLPENLTTEQFREQYGTAGSERYRDQVNKIESRLDSCAGLSPQRNSDK